MKISLYAILIKLQKNESSYTISKFLVLYQNIQILTFSVVYDTYEYVTGKWVNIRAQKMLIENQRVKRSVTNTLQPLCPVIYNQR